MNLDNNKITITTKDNQEIEVEVLDIFNVSGYEEKDYIMYTLGEKVDEENEKVYISILTDKGNNSFELTSITDEQEWQQVEKAIQEELTYGDEMKDE